MTHAAASIIHLRNDFILPSCLASFLSPRNVIRAEMDYAAGLHSVEDVDRIAQRPANIGTERVAPTDDVASPTAFVLLPAKSW